MFALAAIEAIVIVVLFCLWRMASNDADWSGRQCKTYSENEDVRRREFAKVQGLMIEAQAKLTEIRTVLDR